MGRKTAKYGRKTAKYGEVFRQTREERAAARTNAQEKRERESEPEPTTGLVKYYGIRLVGPSRFLKLGARLFSRFCYFSNLGFCVVEDQNQGTSLTNQVVKCSCAVRNED